MSLAAAGVNARRSEASLLVAWGQHVADAHPRAERCLERVPPADRVQVVVQVHRRLRFAASPATRPRDHGTVEAGRSLPKAIPGRRQRVQPRGAAAASASFLDRDLHAAALNEACVAHAAQEILGGAQCRAWQDRTPQLLGRHEPEPIEPLAHHQVLVSDRGEWSSSSRLLDHAERGDLVVAVEHEHARGPWRIRVDRFVGVALGRVADELTRRRSQRRDVGLDRLPILGLRSVAAVGGVHRFRVRPVRIASTAELVTCARRRDRVGDGASVEVRATGSRSSWEASKRQTRPTRRAPGTRF
jgi:hypothetical protein